MPINPSSLIIITGGAGFIGSCAVRHLNDQGYRNLIICDDLKSTEKWKNLVGKHFERIISRENIFEWLEKHKGEVAAILHLGACSSTVESNASYLLDNNTHFSIRLAEIAIDQGIRFVYASSAATYGDGSLGFHDNHECVETLHPLNMYGFSKQLFDLWALRHGHIDKMVGLKYFNVFGPNEAHKGRMASAITNMVPMIQKEGCVRLFKSSDPAHFEDGGQQRDFIYVKDAVRMTVEFLHNDAGGLYNIGTGHPGTWKALAQAVFKALDLPPQIEYINMPVDLLGKYQNYTCADMSKCRKVLGEAVECMPLEESVADYVKGYLLEDKRW